MVRSWLAFAALSLLPACVFAVPVLEGDDEAAPIVARIVIDTPSQRTRLEDVRLELRPGLPLAIHGQRRCSDVPEACPRGGSHLEWTGQALYLGEGQAMVVQMTLSEVGHDGGRGVRDATINLKPGAVETTALGRRLVLRAARALP